MSDLRERLRRFGGVVKPAAPPQSQVSELPPGGPEESLRARLRAREERRGPARPGLAQTGAPRWAAFTPATALPSDLAPVEGPLGAVPARTIEFAASEGARRALALEPWPLALLARDPRLAALDPREAAFLDTETTSLSGGAGVLVFLVAIGRLGADGRFTLRQFFLRDPGSEPAMLAAVAEELGAARAAVTFFGKSFDRHRLEDKFRLHGLRSRFPESLHADLYHISRARFGWKLADGRLRTVERSILGIERERDLPGSEAPRAYFDYLARRPHLLAEVFEHNRDDVVSLVSLLGACGAPFEGARDEERLAAARGAASLGEWDRARTLAARPSASAAREVREGALRVLAEAARRAEGPAAAAVHYEALAALGCGESALAIARFRWDRARDARGALDWLARAADLAAAAPAGASRDALRAAVVRLRVRIERTRNVEGAAAVQRSSKGP